MLRSRREVITGIYLGPLGRIAMISRRFNSVPPMGNNIRKATIALPQLLLFTLNRVPLLFNRLPFLIQAVPLLKSGFGTARLRQFNRRDGFQK